MTFFAILIVIVVLLNGIAGWKVPVSLARVKIAKSITQVHSATTNTKSVVNTDSDNKRRGIGCILGGAMAHLTLGTLYTWGNFLSYAPEKLKFFDGQMHPGVPPDALYVMPLNFACQALIMPFSPNVVKKIGASRTLLLGSWIVAASVYLSSFQTTLFNFMLTYAVVFGAGIGLAYTAPMAAGWKWLPNNKGLVSGGVLTGFGAGGFIFSQIGTKLVNPQGFNPINGRFPDSVYQAFPNMLRKLAGMYLVISFLGSLFVTEPKAATGSDGLSTGKAAKEPEGATVKQALRSKQFWLMWSMAVCSATAGLNTVASYKQFASTISTLTGDQYLALVGGIAAIFNGSGRLLWGLISDTLGFKRTYTIVTLLQAALLLTFPLSTFSKLLFAGNTCGLIFCLAGTLALMPAATQKMFGPKAGTSIYGALYSAFAIASIVGGVLTKGLVQNHGWNVVFKVMALMSVVATGLLVKLKPLESYKESKV